VLATAPFAPALQDDHASRLRPDQGPK
jgi:hypothetical protein